MNNTVEDAIIEVLQRAGPCCLDDLVGQRPNQEWSEMFAAVDQISRDGRLVLRRISGIGYQVSRLSFHAADREVHA